MQYPIDIPPGAPGARGPATSRFGKILGGNVIVLLMVAIAIQGYLVLSGYGEEGVFPLLMVPYVGLHSVLDLLIAIGLGLAGRRDPAIAFLASAPLVLLLGFGVSVGGSALR